MSHEWLDSYDVDESLVRSTGAPMYPIAAWNHEAGGLVGEVTKLDEFDVMLPWPVKSVKFGRGQKAQFKDCYVAQRAEIAVLATRTRWFDRLTGARVDGYQDGAYSRLQLLALVKDGGSTPYMLSFKGVAAGLLSKALTTVRRGPIAAGRRATGKPLSEATFWLTLYAGDPMTVGKDQATEITPPGIELPAKGEDAVNWLGARFVGSKLLAVVNDLAEEATTWAASDSGAGHEEAHGLAPAIGNGGYRHDAWAGPEEPDGIFPEDDPFDALPSASQEPAQAAALATAGKDLFWNLARAKGLAGNTQTEIMARAAEVTKDWTAAIAWLQGMA